MLTLCRVPSWQEDLFSAAKSNEVVASNEDHAVELMMYRQRRSASDGPGEPEAQDPEEPLPDELGPAERGEAPPLREVRTQGEGQLGSNRGLTSPSPPSCRFLQSLETTIASATSR